MKQTIFKKIWVVAFFSSFITCNVLATEIVTAPSKQETFNKDNFLSFFPERSPKNYSDIMEKDINYTPIIFNSVDSNNIVNAPNSLDVLPNDIAIQKAVAEVDKDNVPKENEGFFSTYLNTTQNLISKGVDLFVPMSMNNENSLFYKYKKAKDVLISQGMEYIGIKYKWGGNNEDTGFDCSGLVRAVFQNSIGINLPRTATEMSKVGEKIRSMNSLKPGDLVFFNTMRKSFSHVGIYIGNNKFLHSPRTGATVRVEGIDTSYWKKRFNGATRLEITN